MSLLNTFAILLSIVVIFRSYIRPNLEKKISNGTFPRSPFVLVSSSLIDSFQAILLAATIALGVVLIALSATYLLGGSDIASIGASITKLKWFQDIPKSISAFWAIFVMFTLSAGLMLLSFIKSRNRIRAKHQRLYDEKLGLLLAEYYQGQLEEIPPTLEMKSVGAQIAKCESALEQLQHQDQESSYLIAFRSRIVDLHKQLSKKLIYLDVSRRVVITELPEDEIRQGDTKFDSIIGVVFNKGLLDSFRGVSKALLVLNLIGCFLAFAAVGLQTDEFQNRIEKRISDLVSAQIVLEKERAEATLAAAEDKYPTEVVLDPTSDSEISAADSLALILEHYLFEHPYFAVKGADPSLNRQLNESHGRRKLLAKFNEKAYASEFKQATEPSTGVLSVQDKEIIKTFDAEFGEEPGVKKTLRAGFIRRSRAWIASLPRDAKETVTSAILQFRLPAAASQSDIALALGKQVVSSAIGGFSSGQGDLIESAVNTVLKKTTPDALVALTEAFENQVKARLLNREPLQDAISASLMDLQERLPPNLKVSRLNPAVQEGIADADPKGLINKLKNNKPFLVASDIENNRLEQALAILNAESESPGLRSGGSLDAIATYDDYMLPSPDPALASGTIRGKEQDRRAGSYGGARDQLTRERKTNAARSRSYGKLRGYVRVGGVLLGAEPSNADTLDFRFLDWTVTDSGVVLRLGNSDGQFVSTPPIENEIVVCALAYAADGRPLTVTMVKADPLSELRILLHPALIDNEVGWDAIEIDRFVDHYTSQDVKRERAEHSISSQTRLYSLAWAGRITAVLGSLRSILPTLDSDQRDYLLALESVATNVISGSNYLSLQEILNVARNWSDSGDNLLLAKPAYFDRVLVELIIRYSEGDNPTPAGLVASIASSIAVTMPTFLNNEQQMKQWLALPPEFTVWSGVRELPYTIDENLNFLFPPKDSSLRNADTWPFDFVLQAAFESEGEFSKDADNFLEDTLPWEFPFIKQHLVNQIREKLSKDACRQDILSNMRQFAVAQRLFRLALSGRLGDKFPQARLEILMDSLTKQTFKTRQTPRWNPRQGAIEAEFLITLDYLSAQLTLASSEQLEARDSHLVATCRGLCDSILKATSLSSQRNDIGAILRFISGNLSLISRLGALSTEASRIAEASLGEMKTTASLIESMAEESKKYLRKRKLREVLEIDKATALRGNCDVIVQAASRR